MIVKARFEKFEDLLASPDHKIVADFWRKLFGEYNQDVQLLDRVDPPLPSVQPIEDGGYLLSWNDGDHVLTMALGTKDDDGWFWRDRNINKYDGSEDHEPVINMAAFAKLLRDTPWKFKR